MSSIPVTVRPGFFIFAALIGYMSAQTLLGTVIWMGIIFVSVLFHEYGHALMALFFRRAPRIELVALGGVTYHDGSGLSPVKQFLIILNGPLFGFLLFLITAYLLTLASFSQGVSQYILTLTRDVNLFWTVVNLLPVLPLDGGQLLRILLETFFKEKGVKYTCLVSLILSACLCLFFFLSQMFLPGALFALLSFQSYMLFKQLHLLSQEDQNETLKDLFLKGELALQQGRKEEASLLFEELTQKSHVGLLHEGAIYYLSLLYEEQGKLEESYKLLLSIRKHLRPEGVCLLHKLALTQRDYLLVTELSGLSFQYWPTAEVALRSAQAEAALCHVEPAIGWLETAKTAGALNLKELLQGELFDPIRTAKPFLVFVKNLDSLNS